ncbi:hypothetical protein BDK51DRAFT_45354 [Blyttiomyces helicus]|uniref:Uncharacterized protein n=1 Tax=Blyttiomyces helicus TaxID=388810 RepID=A0A4P9WGX6_9FUNG|nr:hypothetical protein BDK51DRAFT_45354 [Blyttiomyces helicus]|eukprot:RKO91185.1 hypothetical protein BDK51DRAFT_45354 [Blyttiomyces helicus]
MGNLGKAPAVNNTELDGDTWMGKALENLQTALEAERARSAQATIDIHFIFSYLNDINTVIDELPRSQWEALSPPNGEAPAKPRHQIAAFQNSIERLIDKAMRAGELERRAEATEARLRARDGYLQSAIMDTARQVQDLEQKVADLEHINAELRGALELAHRDEQELKLEIAELDDENLMLQNELTSEIAGDPASVTDSRDPWAEYVLLRDVGVQVDYPYASTRDSDCSSSSPAINDRLRRAAGTQTRDTSRPEARLLSMSSRLTYANLIIDAQSETILALEGQVDENLTEIDRLLQSCWDLKLQVEHLVVVGTAKEGVICDLLGRVQQLEGERTARRLFRTVMSLTEAAKRDEDGCEREQVPASPTVEFAAQPGFKFDSSLASMSRILVAPVSTVPPAARRPSFRTTLPAPPASPLPSPPPGDAGFLEDELEAASRAFRFAARRSLVPTPVQDIRKSLAVVGIAAESDVAAAGVDALAAVDAISSSGTSAVMAVRMRARSTSNLAAKRPS